MRDCFGVTTCDGRRAWLGWRHTFSGEAIVARIGLGCNRVTHGRWHVRWLWWRALADSHSRGPPLVPRALLARIHSSIDWHGFSRLACDLDWPALRAPRQPDRASADTRVLARAHDCSVESLVERDTVSSSAAANATAGAAGFPSTTRRCLESGQPCACLYDQLSGYISPCRVRAQHIKRKSNLACVHIAPTLLRSRILFAFFSSLIDKTNSLISHRRVRFS